MRSRVVLLAFAALSGYALLGPQNLAAQGRFGDEEALLLREASVLESDGDLDGAKASLLHLLDIDPTSTGALYALERVLRGQEDLVSLLPSVDRYLGRREDSGIRSLKLQVLVEADSLETMVAESERWIARSPRDETVYTEVARAYEAAYGPDRALAVLVAGREELGGDALALAMGDYHAAQGFIVEAADEWAAAIATDESNMQSVRRRIESLSEGDATDAARNLVRTLADSDDAARRRSATELAIELGLNEDALDLARREARSLSGDARTEYLEEISVAATAAGVAQVSSWAYGELRGIEEDPDERRLLEQRRAEAALVAGDTTAALDSFDRVAASMPTGSADRRLVEARAIRIAAAAAEIDHLRAGWAQFHEAYPESPEIDALAATTAAALVAWGDVDGALAVLEGVSGPRSSVERAYLLFAAGQIDLGREALVAAVGGLTPSEATEVIQLIGLLTRVSGAGAQALAFAGVQAHVGRGGAAAMTLADEAFGLPLADRPVLLAEAARMADRSDEPESGAEIRRRLLVEYPDAPEVGEASLALARHRARVEGNASEAMRILEELIIRQPNAAVVPEARLELERLRS
jgi:tetratricopeptide (TPR) repeat protein